MTGQPVPATDAGSIMRVICVCPYALDRPGGVQGQVNGLARSLRRLGHQVVVLAPGEGAVTAVPPPASAEQWWDSGDVVVVGGEIGVRSNGSVAPVSVSPASAVRVVRWVRRLGPDVIHLHEPMAPVVGYGCLLRRPSPLVGTYHRSGDSRWYRALRPLAGWANRRLDVACAVSSAAEATAEAAMGGTYRVLFNGVEVDRFEDVDPLPTDRPTVLFLGRHEARKGLGVLLEAFASVPDPAALWVAGSGPDTAQLRRRHPESSRVHWLGTLSDSDVARRLVSADVLCAPSLRGESFGMVLLEAMAAGCAVVASDLPGYRDAAGGHALLVPPGSASELRRALAEALAGGVHRTGSRDPGRLAAASRHARRWSMDHLAQRYVDIYQEAVEPGRGPDHQIA
ncbi:MAG: glycosyltransferase family 4 protein [Acidimicrobiales bacterium]